MDRAAFRTRTVGAQKQFRKKEVDLGDGVVAEVRQPSIKSRAAIFKAAKAMSGKADELELAELQVEAVIRCTFINDAHAFDGADRESMLEQPAGGWFDQLSEAALELLNVDEKELRKN